MWWEYAIVFGAVALSLLWLGRRFVKREQSACGGCAAKRPVSRLQTSVPVLDLDRRP